MIFRSRGTNAATGDFVFRNSPAFSAPTEKMIIKNDGKVGIGLSAPTAQLELSLNDAKKPTSDLWTITSDIRVKKNICDADIDMCYNVSKKLKLRRFRWDEKYMRTQDGRMKTNDMSVIGFIAQEVAEIFPKCVFINEEKFFVGKEIVKEVVKDVVDGVEVEREEEKEVDIVETIADFRSLNADQLYKNMWGTIAKLIEKVETLEAEVKFLKTGI